MNFGRRKSRNRKAGSVFDYFKGVAIQAVKCPSGFETVLYAVQSIESPWEVKISITEFLNVANNLDEILLQKCPDVEEALETFFAFKTAMATLANQDYSTSTLTETHFFAKRETIEYAAQVLVRFLSYYTLLPSEVAHTQEKGEQLKLKAVALEVLHEMFVTFEDFAADQRLGMNLKFCNCVLSYMQFMETCFPAGRLMEALMLSSNSVLNLSALENLKEIIVGLDEMQLGNFCKILAIALSDLDTFESRVSLYAQLKQKKNANSRLRDKNHQFILKVPCILSRIMNIVCAKPYVPINSFPAFESEEWLSWIHNRITDEIENERNNVDTSPEDLGSNFIGGVSQWVENGPPKTSVQICLELTFRADAACVLGLLLSGSQRKKAQKELANLRLIPELSDLFDHFVWRQDRRYCISLPGHNRTCECSPEIALKVQVLRLVHSFCDHSEYKHAVLTWSEYKEINSENPSDSEARTKLPQTLMCCGKKGLLSKILDVMKGEGGASTFRFWLSRSVESFLRGSCSTDQDFLLRRDLMQFVIMDMISSGDSIFKEVLQSSFDLLAELVKFNITAFYELNKQDRNSRDYIKDKLMDLIKSNLVDSNMFVRSLILSYEYFSHSEDFDVKKFAAEQCFLMSHFSTSSVRGFFLKKLLSLIHVRTITQENISCLNTALVIIIFGLRRGDLPLYLQTLCLNEQQTFHARPMRCLKKLLVFWKDHYMQKDKDCTILEKSSRICFDEWGEAVALLLHQDEQNPYCISYYTSDAYLKKAS